MELTDKQMRQAWAHMTTEQIRHMPEPTGRDQEERNRVKAGRKRILAIREQDEREAFR